MTSYRIGAVSQLTGVPAWRLRSWEAEGLLRPERSPNGYRQYNDRDLDRIRELASDHVVSAPTGATRTRFAGAGPVSTGTALQLEQAWRELTIAVRSDHDLDSVLRAGLDAALIAASASIGAIGLADLSSHRFVGGASRGLSPDYLANTLNWQLHEGLAGRAFGQREPIAVYDMSTHPGASRAFAWREQLRGYLCVPIVLGAKRLGIIEMFSYDPREFTAAEMEAVEQLSVLLAVAIDAAKAHAQLEELRAQRSRFSRQWTAQWSIASQAERERIASLLESLIDLDPADEIGLDQREALVRSVISGMRSAERAVVDCRRLLRDQLADVASVDFEGWPEVLPLEFATRHALAVGQLGLRFAASEVPFRARASRRGSELLVEFITDDASDERLADIDTDTLGLLDDLGARLGTRSGETGERFSVVVELPRASSSFGELSARERQILHELVGGHSNRELADRFGISVKTLQNHLTSIYRKLDVANRVEAVAVLTEPGAPRD